MPAVSRIGDMSTGHGCFAPTALIQTPVTKTFFPEKVFVKGGVESTKATV